MIIPPPVVLTATAILLFAINNNNKSSRQLSSSSSSSLIHHHHHEMTVVILYNKPANVITSHSEKDALPKESNTTTTTKSSRKRRTTVYEEIMSMKGYVGSDRVDNNKSFQNVTKIQSKLHAIGRLDVDTTGILLLTNDGGLVHHVTNPTKGDLHQQKTTTTTSQQQRHQIQKTYEAIIMGYHDETSSGLERLQTEGIDLGKKHGGKTLPVDDLQILGHPTHKSTHVQITISEGKNRQIRRMFHAIGSGVMKLRRTKIGVILDLSGVEKEGQWRLLTTKEIEIGLGWKPRVILQQQEGRRTNNRQNAGSTKKRHRKRRR